MEKTINYAKYDGFTKDEIIEMFEREKERKNFWSGRVKEEYANYKELARCYDELFKNGVTKTENWSVEVTLSKSGFRTFYKPGEPTTIEVAKETKTILLRDIMKITENETPMDLWVDGNDMSFMSVEITHMNGICLVSDAVLDMEVVDIFPNEENGESRLAITLK